MGKVVALPGKTLVSGSDVLAKPVAPSRVVTPPSKIPFFGGSPDEMASWNIITFRVPGVAQCIFDNTKVTFGGGGPSVKWDVKPAPGTDGASETDQGYQPAQFSITILIHSRPLWDAYQQLITVAKVKPGKTRSIPIEIQHPQIDIFGLNVFVIAGTPWLRDMQKQMKEATFQVIEYFAKPTKRAEKTNLSDAGLQTIFSTKTDHIKPHRPTRPRVTESKP